MDDKEDKFNLLSSIKVLVSPWEKGFSCGIILDTRNKMSDEQFELVSTIARGMIKQATTDPHSTFLAGIRGFADDRKYRKQNEFRRAARGAKSDHGRDERDGRDHEIHERDEEDR